MSEPVSGDCRERDDFCWKIKTCDMHTAGEAVRIIEEGYPLLIGNNILEKRAYAKLHYDVHRQLVINEPRGHRDMYGVIVTKPTHPEADMAVLFIHNSGYSTMCGHAIIALGRYAVDKGYVSVTSPETKVVFECPCGIVRASVCTENQRSGRVRFSSVPCFTFKLDAELTTDRFGKLKVDIAYGGAFYAVVSASTLSMNLDSTPLSVLVEAAADITDAVKSQVTLHHPDSDDLAFAYGTILTDDNDGSEGNPTKNICVYADKAVDRSPTGSGVSTRMAILFSRGCVAEGETREFKSLTGSTFTGKVLKETSCGPYNAVIVEVSGRAFYTGEHTFKLEKGDPFTSGFFLHQ